MVETREERGRDALLSAFRKQIVWCHTLGSPFTAQVLAILADDIAAGGVTAGLVDNWPGDPAVDALPLRLAAGLHALVLMKADGRLARCYPAAGIVPTSGADVLREALLTTMAERSGFLLDFIVSSPQTNEVGRSGVLLGGFLRIAEITARPLRLLEIGASAGLNLIWDRYRYAYGAAEWGDPSSPMLLAPNSEGPTPPVHASLQIADRQACDVAPIDLTDAAQRLRLKSYVWADQRERLQRLDDAIALALDARFPVEQADAASWVAARLRELPLDCTTVLYHSIMWQYMPDDSQKAITTAVLVAGARATSASPLAWLRFEPVGAGRAPELRLTTWPGGREERLATAHAHGSEVTWLFEHG